MSEPVFYPRYIEPRLAEALEDSPVVLIHGPRQCGKTTLAQFACAPDYLKQEENDLLLRSQPRNGGLPARQRNYAYVNFDDAVARNSAQADPMGFVADLPERVILDEIQRVPDLLPAIKMAVDRRRTPGRFILTGSTNVLLIPTLSESLAGRLQILRLHPLAQRELASGGEPALSSPSPNAGFLNALFEDGFAIRQTRRLGERLSERIIAGGFPPALARPTARRQANWYRDYITTLVQRDVRDMARIKSLDMLPRLLSASASQTARLFNLADLASPFQLARPTVGNYVTLLERLFLLERLPPWHSNRLRRLIKSPKLHIGDTGLAATLLGVDSADLMADRALLGQLLETFVFQELRRQASWHDAAVSFFHFRDKDGAEVDIVLERGLTTIAGVEVKASGTVTKADFRGLSRLARAAGERFAHGVVLYDGEIATRFGDRMYAIPIRQLWETA